MVTSNTAGLVASVIADMAASIMAAWSIFWRFSGVDDDMVVVIVLIFYGEISPVIDIYFMEMTFVRDRERAGGRLIES